MSRMLAPLLAVLALAAAPLGHAYADAPELAYGEPHPHHPPAVRASDAAARAAVVARRELGESPISYELDRLSVLLMRAEGRNPHRRGHAWGRRNGRALANRIAHQIARVDEAFAEFPGRPGRPLRRAMRELEAVLVDRGHPPFRAPSRAPRPEPAPLEPPYPHRPLPEAAFHFEGSFEGIPVVFEAPTIDALFGQCRSRLAASRASAADDITMFGVPERNVTSYWTPDALCAIVALNARPAAMHIAIAPVEGRVESVPFRVVSAPNGGAERVLRRYLPIALQGENIDDVVVGGQRIHNGPGFWSVEDAVQIVLAHAYGDPYAARQRPVVYFR